jgi:hypothetical protein
VAVLFEVRATGFQTKKQWLSVFDLQAGMFLPNKGSVGSFHYKDGMLKIELSPQ